MYKAGGGLLAIMLLAVVAARLAYQSSICSNCSPTQAPWQQNQMAFTTWNQEKWTAWIRGGAFEHRPLNMDRWSRHAKPVLAFYNWEGEPWQAKLGGEGFLLAYRGDWDGEVIIADAIRYRDWQGRNMLRTFAQLSR